ncbi:glycosyltransferase family 2 protein [Phenylobacterium sp.]|uniref:glycosyltransferase family 2 protein n=1 Tax=Phenylobacterium sp. TaxID=1871053 RepID=UPI002736AFC5|nr:glycosyltransferase family 2 protein [Phenylobacterium sp.]MDP3659650.1 glycosyltransferase family 2 protein [Phenylobacterium sp.]
MILVSVVIPTQRRPVGLAAAAGSVLRQTGVDPSSVELLVVDNDQAPSAEAMTQALAVQAPFAVRYIHEPRAGVAHARNAAMAQARGDFVAFLDDDEEAPSGWLHALLDVQARFDADVVFGPVRGRLPDEAEQHRPYLEQFFSRVGPDDAGLLDHYYGCGDSLVRRAALPDAHAPFSAERNHIGGEDDLLFGQMKARGARFAWAPDAWVWEDPAPGRLSLRYTLARAFAYGQGPSAACAAQSPPDRLGVAKWMAVGLGQAAAFGALALVKWAVHAQDFAFTLDRAARGLGKTLWWGPFKVQFYGLSVTA